MPFYPFKCNVCKNIFNEFQHMNDKHEFIHCGKQASRIWSNPETNRDRMYKFVTEQFGSPIEITSKRQYKKLLKQHGQTDCTTKEVFQECRHPKQQSNLASKELFKKVRDTMYHDGVLKHLPGFCKKFNII